MKKKIENKRNEMDRGHKEKKTYGIGVLFLFSSFYFLLRFTKTCLSDFIGINTKSSLRDEGYA